MTTIVERPKSRGIVNAIISAHFGARGISVLEAGGGDRSRVSKARNINISRITVVDIDKDQLARNSYANTKINADLQNVVFEEKYDLIEIIYVLEHIEYVDKALLNIASACNEDGLIVVCCPYMYAFSGFITRFTPHWFHVLFRKVALGEENAGKEGFPPFRTFYNPLIAPKRMTRFLNQRGFSTELLIYFESPVYERLGALKWLFYGIIAIMNALTPKSYNAMNGEYFIVFKNKAHGAS